MRHPSSALVPRACRSQDFSLLALDHFPTFELGKWSTLFDPDDVAYMVLVGLVMGIVFFRAAHGLLHDGMGKSALDTHDYGLVLLIADNNPLQCAFRHLSLLRLGFCRSVGFSGTLLGGDGLDARDIATNLPHARSVLQLTGRALKTQVEALLLELENLILELIEGHATNITGLHDALLSYSAIRSMNRVLIGSLAAASPRASRASPAATPSISNRMRPGLTRATQNSGAPLPDPMRTSSGFFDTGTSGYIRIQTRPARFMWRVSARRAASICRAVTRSGSIAFSPNSPKFRANPPFALP